MVTVKVWTNPKGQAFLTIPKAIFESMDWKKYDSIDIKILGKDKLKLERVKNRTTENNGGISS